MPINIMTEYTYIYFLKIENVHQILFIKVCWNLFTWYVYSCFVIVHCMGPFFILNQFGLVSHLQITKTDIILSVLILRDKLNLINKLEISSST